MNNINPAKRLQFGATYGFEKLGGGRITQVDRNAIGAVFSDQNLPVTKEMVIDKDKVLIVQTNPEMDSVENQIAPQYPALKTALQDRFLITRVATNSKDAENLVSKMFKMLRQL
jgi:hypothetical protein